MMGNNGFTFRIVLYIIGGAGKKALDGCGLCVLVVGQQGRQLKRKTGCEAGRAKTNWNL